MKLDILNIEGEKTGRQVTLPESVFGVEPNEHVVYLAVKQYLANQRQGTHKTKERGEIRGSRRKIKRQKGTGTARFGDIKNPIFRGGGRIFGPRPRKYTLKLNKKVKRLARKSALSDMYNKGRIMVVEDFTFEEPHTREYVNILNNLGIEGKSLLVTSDYDTSLYNSCKNIYNSNVMCATDLNTYAVMNAGTLILSEEAVSTIGEAFG